MKNSKTSRNPLKVQGFQRVAKKVDKVLEVSMRRYIIKTGQLEKGTQEQQTAFIQLFGTENVQYKFDL